MAPSGHPHHQDRWRPARRLLRPVEAFQIRWFGRSLVSMAVGTPVLVLHTTGRRTGRARSTPLAVHHEPDGAFVVVGGAGGQARVPDWVANLRARPVARVTVDRRTVDVLAEEVEGPERALLWEDLTKVWPRIVDYERRSGRVVPVFRLHPAG